MKRTRFKRPQARVGQDLRGDPDAMQVDRAAVRIAQYFVELNSAGIERSVLIQHARTPQHLLGTVTQRHFQPHLPQVVRARR